MGVISPIVHMVVENFRATLKHLSYRRMRPPMKGEDTLDRRCVRATIWSPGSDRLMTTGEDTLERRCEGHDRSPSSDRLMTTGEDTLEKV